MAEVHHECRDGVAVLTLDRPVANALAPTLRSELRAALEAAVADETVQAIVLCGAGAQFSSGVDLTEFDAPAQSPRIDALCRQIEDSPKPIVAALHGVALGGGFELALAAHGRVAAVGTRVGLPEVTLGLIPHGGATQRVPRLAGAQVALELMLGGRPIDVSDPRLSRIIDEVVPDRTVDAAVAAAKNLARVGNWPRARDRSAGLSDPLGYQKSLAEVKARLRSDASAEADIVHCIEAAQLLPFARGLELEQVSFEDRRTSPEARARRHYHAAERRALIMPERARGRVAAVSRVVIPGDDTLTVELAVACLDAGLHVALMAEDVPGTDAVRHRIENIYDGAVTREILSPDARDAVMARVEAAWPAEALGRADLVLDTGRTDLQAHHGELGPATIWTSVSEGGEMPATAPQMIGERLVGLRVYRPALSTALVELCVPPAAAADTVVTVAELFNRMGRVVIRCDCVDGLVGGNLSAAFFGAALTLAGEGARPYRIDAAARKMGFAAGPFQLMDSEGLAGVAERLNRRSASAGDTLPDNGLLAERIAAGVTGRAVGHGFYRYDDKGAHPDPDLPQGTGSTEGWTDRDLAAALEAAIVNEATRLIVAQVVQRASDIDVVMVSGFGFDRARGGPLFQADLQGLFNILKDMKRCAVLSAPIWQPNPAIEDMVKNGTGFFGRPA